MLLKINVCITFVLLNVQTFYCYTNNAFYVLILETAVKCITLYFDGACSYGLTNSVGCFAHVSSSVLSNNMQNI